MNFTAKCLLTFVILIPLSARAETVYMHDGSSIKGTIKSTKGGKTAISTKNGDITVENSKIIMIDPSNYDESKLTVIPSGTADPASIDAGSKDLNAERLRIISEKQRLNAEKTRLLEEEQKLNAEEMKLKRIDYSKEYAPDTPATENTQAIAADGSYFGINIGISAPSDSDVTVSGFNGKLTYDSGFAFGAALGHKTGIGKIEAEIGYKTAAVKSIEAYGVSVKAPSDATLSVLSILANGYIDFDASPTVRPYIMGGLGVAKLSLEGEGDSESVTVFASQAGLGLGIAASEKVTVDLGYRYMITSNADFEETTVTYNSHNFIMGLRFIF